MQGGVSSTRPGSAPKRTATPSSELTTTGGSNSHVTSTGATSLVIKNQSSSGGSKQTRIDGSASGTASKNMLNSFRNGPIK